MLHSLDYDCLLKFILVGDVGVGKSSLLLRFVQDDFHQAGETTIGVEFGVRVLAVDGRRAKLQIWDTSGQEAFRSVTRAYYRGAAGVLLVYDVSRRKTFEHVLSWLQDVRGVQGAPTLTLVGNKADLEEEREVSEQEGRALAQELGAAFFETSARRGRATVEAAFEGCARGVLRRVAAEGSEAVPGFRLPQPAERPASSQCCL